MRKANKKLASAIVLGLMLAVPVGVSAAQTVDTNSDGYVASENKTYTGDVTFVSTGRDSADAVPADNAIIGTHTEDISFTTNGGNVILDSDSAWVNNAFSGAAADTLTISNVGSIIADHETVRNYTVFSAYNGNVVINNVKDITLNNVYTGLFAQVGDSNNIGSGSINATLTGDLNLKSNIGILAANYNNNPGELSATVNVTAKNIVIDRITEHNATDSAYGTKYNNNFAIASVSEQYKTSEDNDRDNTGYAGQTSVNIEANSIKIYADKGDEYGAILAANGKNADDAGVSLEVDDIYIEGDIVADKNANIGIGGKENSEYHTAVIKGDIKATDSVINLDLGTNGSLTGSVVYNSSTAGVATLDGTPVTNGITINMGSGSVWNVTDDSSVTKLEGEGAVKIADTDVTEVKIGSAAEGITYGNTAEVTDTFKSAADAETYAAKFKVGGGEDGLKNATYKSDAGSVLGDIYVSYDGDGKATVTQKVNEDNQAISNMASIGLMAWRAENNDMNKRLGELRNSNGEHGVWARMVRGESEFGAQNVKNVYNTYQLGYDEKLSTNDHWTVGAAISYTDGQSSFATGSGENTSKGLSFYGSYLGDNGEFVDLIAKYARLDNEFDVAGGAGSGDYSTNGYSFSAEFGKRNQLANDFYFEPQVELTYGRVADVDYVTDKGVNVSQDSMDSLVGRVGFAAGKNIKNGNVYVRASYLYDFDGETNVTFVNDAGANTSFSEDLGGGWFEFGIGTNINLSDATYLYLDVEKTTGGEVDTNWQWNAGVRYSF